MKRIERPPRAPLPTLPCNGRSHRQVEARPSSAPAADRRGSRWPLLTVAVGAVTLAALDLWWYAAHQRGFPMYTDESGYTAFALTDAQGIKHGGPSGLVHAVETQSVHGPLVPLLTAPVDLLTGPRIAPGYVVIAAFSVILALSTYALARRLTTGWTAALAALVVATAPGTMTFARAYYFAVPAAALLTASIWCFLQSDGLEHALWAIGGGVLLGLALLSRTQVLALVPGVLGAGLIQVLATRSDLRRRLTNLTGATVATGAVAATWYARNAGDAIGWLLGTRFRAPGSGHRPYQLAPVLRDIRAALDVTQVPVALTLIAIVVLAGLTSIMRRRTRTDRRPADRPRSVGGDGLFLAAFLLELVTVFAIADYALGEWLIALPILVTLALATLPALQRATRIAMSALLVVLAVGNVVMVSGIAPALAQVRTVDSGVLGPVPITDGRQFVQQVWAPFDTGPPGRLRPSLRAVPPLQRELTTWLTRYASHRGEVPVVFAVGPESRFLSINDFLLSDRLRSNEPPLLVGHFEYGGTIPPLRAFCTWLDEPQHGLPNFVTVHVLTGSAPGRRLSSNAERRVAAVGFRPVRTVSMPDGPIILSWRSQADVPRSCPTSP